MKKCPICEKEIKQLNPRHIKNCFGDDPNYKYQYIIRNTPSATKEELNRLYVDEKWSTNMLRDHFLLDLKSICYLLNFYGIEIRTIKETRGLKEYKDRIETTNLQKYGAINPLSKGTKPFRKRNQTIVDKYGCENVFQRLDLFVKDWSSSNSRSKVSSLNKEIYKVLNELGIKYKPEHSISYRTEEGKPRWKSYDILVGDLIIEINGDYWHANPKKYKGDEIFYFPKSTLSAEDIWNLDKYKRDIAENHGYRYMVIWEEEVKNNLEYVKQIIKDSIDKKGDFS
jgi:hypothetical protein